MGELIGYARCSTVLQDLTAQRELSGSIGGGGRPGAVLKNRFAAVPVRATMAEAL